MKQLKIIPGSDEWENICMQCGICCLVKYQDPCGKTHLTNVRCDKLDPITHKCGCYSSDASKRNDDNQDSCFNHDGSSLNPDTMHEHYLVPGHCPYVKLVFGTKPLPKPNIDWDKTVSENEAKNDTITDHVIPGSHKYFKYNPELNAKLHAKAMKKQK